VNDGSTRDNDAGNSFLDCAVEIAKSIEGLEGRSEMLSLIAVKYAAAGQLDRAVDLAETINDSYLRDQALAGVSAKCIEVGAADYADKLSETIEDDTAYAVATEQMALAYAESRAFENAVEVAHRLTESAPTLSRIALAWASAGHSAKALEVARSLDYPDLKASVLVELAEKAFDDGRGPEAQELLLEAIKAAGEIEFPEPRISALVAIACVNQKCGQEEQAFEILTEAHRLCNESEDLVKDSALAQIAVGFAELKRYDQVDSAIGEIEDPFQFAHATTTVAFEYLGVGDSTRALTLFADALEIGRDEEVYGDHGLTIRESLLHQLALGYATAGDYEEALQIPALMNSQDQQNQTLGEIAKLCARAGNNSRVFEVSAMIKDNYARVIGDLGIVDAFIASEQLALADHTLSEALVRTATIAWSYQKATALIEIAPRLARREQTAKASEVLFEALTTVALIDDGYRQSQALINLAGKYGELGQAVGEREEAVLEEMRVQLE
jgi:tetratricopeptide (TPR) repeat protein